MTDAFGKELPIIEGHETGLYAAGGCIVLWFLVYSAMRQFDIWRAKKKKEIDPHAEHENLGSH